MNIKINKGHRYLRPLAIGLIALFAIAGCASMKNATVGEGTAEGEGVPHKLMRGEGASSISEGKVKLYPGTGVLVKAPAAIPMDQKPGELTLNFEAADIREVVKTILGDIMNESYIMDPRVAGTITLHTSKPIPRSAVLPTLETALSMSGAVLLKQADGVYQVLPTGMAGKGNLTPALGGIDKPLPHGYSMQVVPLKYIGVADMARILAPLVSDQNNVRQDPIRNLLFLSGPEPELRHVMETIDMFDVDWLSGMSVGLFTLQNVDAKTVAGDMEKLFGDKNVGPLAGALRVVPIDRINALLVVTPQAQYLDKARTWIERLDQSGAAGSGQRLFVYQVQNGKAELLASLLNDAFGKKAAPKTAPAPTLAPGLIVAEVKNAQAAKPVQEAQSVASGDSLALPGNVRIIADKDNNALLILASAGDYEAIQSALRKLDVVPRQVLIEVTIAEVTLTGELKYGLDWAFNNGSKVSGAMSNFGIAASLPFSATWTSATGKLKAVLNALASDSKLKIISSPHITVADNQKASIQVGDQVPTITSTQSATASTTGVISSVQYLNTGVLLSVTPHSNSGGLVTMDINQEVSNAAKTTSSTIDSPTISKRTAQSTVTVQSGETLVLAGLISDTSTRADSGLPLLHRLPLVGGLFGSLDNTDNRTELIILITPRVLKTVQQASEITEEYKKRLGGLERLLDSAGVKVKSSEASQEKAKFSTVGEASITQSFQLPMRSSGAQGAR